MLYFFIKLGLNLNVSNFIRLSKYLCINVERTLCNRNIKKSETDW